MTMQERSQKSREGGAAVLFDIARIRKGVLEPLVCALGGGARATAAPY